ncbi:MAG: VWA domain-containing protein [Acidobacteria bacterium]|nr:VWA domain-containing protein [Acidobacteriota bacterium]
MAGLDVREQDLATNKEQRTPCLLALDVSNSMSGAPIEELNKGLALFEHEIKKDDVAALRSEVAIVTFGGEVTLVQDFVSATQFAAPQLHAGGDTPLGAAIDMAIAALRARKQAYKRNGVNYTRPWLFVISDGAPTDDWQPAAQRLRQEEAVKGVVVFPIGVLGADLDVLAELSTHNSPRVLEGLAFSQFFQWLSTSQEAASAGRPGGSVQMPSPEGWTQAPT